MPIHEISYRLTIGRLSCSTAGKDGQGRCENRLGHALPGQEQRKRRRWWCKLSDRSSWWHPTLAGARGKGQPAARALIGKEARSGVDWQTGRSKYPGGTRSTKHEARRWPWERGRWVPQGRDKVQAPIQGKKEKTTQFEDGKWGPWTRRGAHSIICLSAWSCAWSCLVSNFF